MVENFKKTKASSLLESFDGVLSPEELDSIRKEAKTKVLDESKKDAKKRALDAAIREEKSKVDPDEVLEKYQIDLPGYSDGILLDGVKYFQGGIYTFTSKQLATIKDIVFNAWRHENEVGGVNRKSYIPPREHGSYALSGVYGRFR